MAIAIEIDSVSVVIDKKHILSDITASVAEGEIVGLLGPSGAGKTTLIRTILGLQSISEGTVKVLGVKAGSKELRSKIGYVTQAPSVYTDLSVIDNLHYFASLVAASRQEVEHVLKAVELDVYRNRLVTNLSGGQRA